MSIGYDNLEASTPASVTSASSAGPAQTRSKTTGTHQPRRRRRSSRPPSMRALIAAEHALSTGGSVEPTPPSILDAHAEAGRIDGGAALALRRLRRAIFRHRRPAELEALIQAGRAHVTCRAGARVAVHSGSRCDAARRAVLSNDRACVARIAGGVVEQSAILNRHAHRDLRRP